MRQVDGGGGKDRAGVASITGVAGVAGGLPHAVAVGQNLCCSVKFYATGGKTAGKTQNNCKKLHANSVEDGKGHEDGHGESRKVTKVLYS